MKKALFLANKKAVQLIMNSDSRIPFSNKESCLSQTARTISLGVAGSSCANNSNDMKAYKMHSTLLNGEFNGGGYDFR